MSRPGIARLLGAWGGPAFLAGFLAWACTGDPAGPSGPGTRDGMLRVRAAGNTFLQGAAGASAGHQEGPPIGNSFTYDYEIDATEITQAKFLGLMGRNPVAGDSPFGAGAGFPVYNVSWFDAALFCNARSKAAGLDTVYEYGGAERNPDGSVYNLLRLSVRLERFGFRLPTEAEWEFSARAGSQGEYAWDTSQATQYAWYAANAGNQTHQVGLLKANAFGLHDMAGNVMEWVGDWKAAYPGTGSSDFAGARDPGPEYDSPVKGGAFKFGLRALRPASRTGVYASIRSSRSEYVGFRCVLGAVRNPRFSTPTGGLATTDPVGLDITRLQGLVEGRPAKLVFVNASSDRRQLAYVDYRQHPPRLREFEDASDVFYPAISPDGALVAYGTAVEGAREGSRIMVRSLDEPGAALEAGQGFIPRWWVAEKDTFLLFTTSAADNSQAHWSATKTLMQRMSGGRPQGEPVALTAAGGFHDGRSRDGRWLATGYRHLKSHDLQAGVTRTLFTSPDNGKDGEDTSQVCNVSMAPDSTGRILFLDFGYEADSRITGSYYGIHQVAFLAGPDGKVRRWFKAPAPEAGWEDLEWSNHPDFAVSASTDKDGRHRNLYLLNLRDSIFTRLLGGTQLAMPGLWLGGLPDSIPTDGLGLDSLGHYNEPATDIYQSVFSRKMTLFWNRHRGIEVMFTGSSHVFGGIDPGRITGLDAFNMGFPANGWLGQEAWVDGYALNHCPRLKVLVMEAFPGWLHHPGGDFTWEKQISRTLGVQYDAGHGFWKDGLPFGFEAFVRAAPNETGIVSDSLGLTIIPTEGWGQVPGTVTDGDWGLDNANYLAVMRRIEGFAARVAERKIHLILLNFPTHPAFKGNKYYGPYGPRLEVAEEVIRRFRAMEGISPYVHFYDAHVFNEHDYTDAEALNDGHLSTVGARKLTSRLDSLIKTLPMP